MKEAWLRIVHAFSAILMITALLLPFAVTGAVSAEGEKAAPCPTCPNQPNPALTYGPHRTSPDYGTPKHAYSPFYDIEESSSPPAEFVPGQVLIKFKPEVMESDGRLRATPPGASPLSGDYGITGIQPIFPSAASSDSVRRLSASASSERGLERWVPCHSG